MLPPNRDPETRLHNSIPPSLSSLSGLDDLRLLSRQTATASTHEGTHPQTAAVSRNSFRVLSSPARLARHKPSHLSLDLSPPKPGRPVADDSPTVSSHPNRWSTFHGPDLPTPFSRDAWDNSPSSPSPSSPTPFAPRDLDQYVVQHLTTPVIAAVLTAAFFCCRFPHGHGHTPNPNEHSFPSFDKPLPNLPGASSLSIPQDHRPPHGTRESSFHTAHASLDSLEQDRGSQSTDGDLQDTLSTQHTRTMSTTMTKPVELKLQVESRPSTEEPQRAKSPMSSFFGWNKSKSKDAESPSTSFDDDRSVSPMPSPLAQSPPRPSPLGNAAMHEDEGYHGRSGSLTYGESANLSRVDELMRELQEVSTELAASIRREMELEDEIERFQAEMPPPSAQEPGRRTSDYYSDSGASSVRYPIGETETKLESLEKMRRKLEQDKAQMRVDLSSKVQEDMNQKKALELHIQTLEGQLRMASFQSEQPSEKEKELEASLTNTQRKLNEEKQFKDNFDELLAGMRSEIEVTRNERDNLKDEVVPQLKARVEGLESEAGQAQTLQYEITRLQQEVQTLKNENQSLNEARKMQTDFQASTPRMKGVAASGLARSDSQKAAKENIPLDQLPAHLKDVEDQRDALHLTLKNLIIRQYQMTTDYRKQVKQLEADRDRAKANTPRRAAFAVEVQYLRNEVNKLRRRADDALEQKWQCEKGLSGIKMDLDRAQQETASLRELLKEHDIFESDNDGQGGEDESDSLDKAYTELRSVQELVKNAPDATTRESAEIRMEQLSRQVSSQLSTNQQLRSRLAEAIGRGEKEQGAAAQKIMDLQGALKVAEERLAAAQAVSEEAIAKHEEHVRLVKEAQEDQFIRGVTSSVRSTLIDTKFASQNNSARVSLLSPASAKGPITPFKGRRPRLNKTTSGKAFSFQDATRTSELEMKVRQMEEAAIRAESEMSGVVEAMNRAQIEVALLQTERDEEARKTRKLQREVVAEREKIRAAA